MDDGTVSPRFPKDLKGLFSLDGEFSKGALRIRQKKSSSLTQVTKAESVKALMNDYEFKQPLSSNNDHNLNRFMQFCGVRYQLVARYFPYFRLSYGKTDLLKR